MTKQLPGIELIAIGVSAGGPMVLKTILSLLPRDFPPILIVQHISPGFIEQMAQWLATSTGLPVLVAESHQLPKRGHVYFAPDEFHMGIMKNGRIFLKSPDSKNEICPSVSFLLSTVAAVFRNRAMGILLTGMGADGVNELKLMKEQGSITVAQNRETSLIYGMPGQAVAMGAVKYELSPTEIAQLISDLSV